MQQIIRKSLSRKASTSKLVFALMLLFLFPNEQSLLAQANAKDYIIFTFVTRTKPPYHNDQYFYLISEVDSTRKHLFNLYPVLLQWRNNFKIAGFCTDSYFDPWAGLYVTPDPHYDTVFSTYVKFVLEHRRKVQTVTKFWTLSSFTVETDIYATPVHAIICSNELRTMEGRRYDVGNKVFLPLESPGLIKDFWQKSPLAKNILTRDYSTIPFAY